MKLSINLKFAAVLVSFVSLPIFAQKAQPTLANLGWMAGCWEINKPEKKILISEQWMLPVGDAMIGMSRTMRNGKMGGFEFLRIVQDHTGINYISRPSDNKEETAFTLLRWAPNEVIFENPTHDFPQRVIYKLTKPNLLVARIEGTMNGKSTGTDFPLVRTQCRQ